MENPPNEGVTTRYSGSGLESRAKLMQNQLILNLIAKGLTAQDLWSLRPTCVLWNSTFVPILKTKQDLKDLDCVCAPICYAAFYTLPDGSAYSLTPAPNRKRPCKYTVENWNWEPAIRDLVTKYCLHDLNRADPQIITDFFGGTGSKITHLDLKFGYNETILSVSVDRLRWLLFEQTPNLVHLRLGDATVYQAPPPYSTPDNCPLTRVRDLPKLRQLYVARNTETRHLRLGYRKLLGQLVRHATGLETLSLGPATIHGDKNWHILDALQGGPPCLTKLKQLEIQKLDVDDLQILVGLGNRLQLASFVTSLEYINEYEDDQEIFGQTLQLLHQFMDSQTTTLRQLSLELKAEPHGSGSATIPATTQIDLPTLPGVHTFWLDCSVWEQIGPDFDPEPLPPQDQRRKLFTKPLEVIFPGLVKFEFVNTFAMGRDVWLNRQHIVDDMRGFGHSGVTDLSLDTNYVRVHKFHETYGLRFGFQQLNHLKIKLRPNCISIFTQICGSIPGLEVLVIVYERQEPNIDGQQKDPTSRNLILERDAKENALDLDPLLTGIPKQSLGKLQRVLDVKAAGLSGQLTVTSLRIGLQEYKTEPGLQDLARLKKFVLKLVGPATRFRLTDIGGYFGFVLAARSLQHIALETVEPGDGNNSGIVSGSEREKCPDATGGDESGNLLSTQCKQMLRDIYGPALVMSF